MPSFDDSQQPALALGPGGLIALTMLQRGNIVVALSHDGGASFSPPVIALDCNGQARGGRQRGPRIGMANQRYASTSETQAFLRHAAERSGVPLQVFVTRADMACGSTIGPLTAARIGVRTVDVGIPQLGMHSVRELCGADDPHALFRLLQGCFQAA